MGNDREKERTTWVIKGVLVGGKTHTEMKVGGNGLGCPSTGGLAYVG